MAKLEDVNFAMQGEAKQNNLTAESVQAAVVESIRQVSPVEDTKYHVFKLVGNNRKGGVYINGIDDVYNEATKKMERIRLLAGVDSIWMKDQKDISAEYVKHNLRSLHFPRGVRMIQIPSYDTTALDFARICSHNVGSKNKKAGSPYEFYEFDAAREEKEAFAREDYELEMALKAKQAGAEEMKKHAVFLGILLTNELGMPKGEDGIRMEYVRAAKRNPKYFESTFGTKQVDVAWLVKKARIEGLIEVNREPGKVFWANGGRLICAIPMQTDPDKYLTELALTNTNEGKQFLEELQKVVK